MIIKVCGMREPENIRAVEATRPDWMGFILWPGSKRYVPAPPAYLPQAPVQRVGVFVNPSVKDVVLQAQAFQLDLIQLHGHESPTFCLEVKNALQKNGLPALPLIKAFSISTPADLLPTRDYISAADYFLFDTKSPLPGGSGQQFDWSILETYDGPTPFLLSGGIGPGDLPRLLAYRHPRCIGVDLNSRFETAPAIKDAARLEDFIKNIKANLSL